MGIDEGPICGGFPRNYEAHILAHDEPLVLAVEAATGVVRHSIDIAFQHDDGDSGIVTIAEGGRLDGSGNCLFTTPDPDVVGVRAYGTGSFVDLRTRTIGVLDHLIMTASDIDGHRMFLSNDWCVVATDGRRTLWTSRMVAAEGITGLRYADGVVHGLGDALGTDLPFEIDADTGEAKGGFEQQSL